MDIIVLQHPQTVTLHNYTTVRVLTGSISILASIVNSETPLFAVFSSEKTGLITISTECPGKIMWNTDSFISLRNTIEAFTSLEVALKVVRHVNRNSVIIILEQRIFPGRLQFLELYYPEELKFGQNSTQHNGCFVLQDNISRALTFDTYCNNLTCDIRSYIETTYEKVDGPRILIFGPVDSGKTFAIRYFVNTILNDFTKVYYLDADPAETEFTPPGTVGITEVTKPILGPQFARVFSEPEKMIFTGSYNAASKPQMYQKCINQLMEFYNATHAKAILLVNAIGCVPCEQDCFSNLLTSIRPTVLIEIIKDKPSRFNYTKCLGNEVSYFCIDVEKCGVDSYYRAPLMRNLSLLSYFGRHKPNFSAVQCLDNFRCYVIKWEKLALYHFNYKISRETIVDVFNASIVALCTVEKSQIVRIGNYHEETTLEEEPDNICLGFGIIRGIDILSHKLYVITPLTLDKLAGVNAIMKGDVLLPDVMLLKQPCNIKHLPYTNMSQHPPDCKED